jgi:hypothetical protein
MCEPYAVLRYLNKPVDLILLNTAESFLTVILVPQRHTFAGILIQASRCGQGVLKRRDSLASGTETVILDSLKAAKELVQRASEMLGDAAKEVSLPSESARRSIRDELDRIRFHMAMLSRNATILRAVANRRKPTLAKEPKPRHIT